MISGLLSLSSSQSLTLGNEIIGKYQSCYPGGSSSMPFCKESCLHVNFFIWLFFFFVTNIIFFHQSLLYHCVYHYYLYDSGGIWTLFTFSVLVALRGTALKEKLWDLCYTLTVTVFPTVWKQNGSTVKVKEGHIDLGSMSS